MVVFHSRIPHQRGIFIWFQMVSFETFKNIKRCKSIDLQRYATKRKQLSRDDWIRTSDHTHPMRVRYQTAPHPESGLQKYKFYRIKKRFSKYGCEKNPLYFPDKNSRISKLNASLASGESFNGFIKK